MKVRLLAATYLHPSAVAILEQDHRATDADHLGEVAGRACYQSFDRPNPATAANADYLANVLAQGHESVVSHASASFYVEGVSRSLTHELIRHRWLAFSELSQRYVAADDFTAVYPPEADAVDRADIDAAFGNAIARYRQAVERGEARGLSRKRARQAARAHLPLCTETRIVVSGNHRAFRDFLRQRLAPGADAEIRQLALELHRQLSEIAPNTYADITPDL